jgi:Cu(I)/Ag(I) efflux system membrane fusion protein
LRDQGLKDQREGFKELSGRMIDLLRRVPATRAAAPRLFIIHCPMAHADWIQDSDEIANPYYGDVMPDCGAVKEVIETVSP